MEQATTKTTFIPGDEWVYYKVYMGYNTSDTVLMSLIRPMVNTLLKEKYISSWFFIRYGDPDHHLRIRFRMTDNQHLSAVVGLFNQYIQPYIDNHLIWKIQLGTYQRELERYTPQLIEHAEYLFFIDSEMLLNSIIALEESPEQNLRWLFGLFTIDSMLAGFKLTDEERLTLMSTLKDSFEQEFNMVKHAKKQLADKFRKHRKEIDRFMNREDDNPLAQHLYQLADQKNERLAPVYEEIKKVMANPKGMTSLLSSYIHMLMNRLFRSKNRQNETVSYFLLYSYYRSSIAKKKSKKVKKEPTTVA